MALIGILLLLVAVITFLIVLGDMFRKKIWLGILGIFLFPIVFFYAFTYYSGRRFLVGSVLLFSWGFPYLYSMYQIDAAESELDPFLSALESEGNIECVMGGVMHTNQNTHSFDVYCDARSLNPISYASVTELEDRYREDLLIPVMNSYLNNSRKIETKFTLGILSPSGIYACFDITPPGKINRSWNTSESEPCG